MADIAINPVTRRVQFTGNTGTGPFAFTFNILADADIAVYKNTTLLTLTTHYTVTTNANGTGSITLDAGQALISSDVLTIIGGRDLSRTTDFVTAGDLLASSLNEQLDSLVIMTQQLDEKVGRTIKTNPGDVYTDLELPTKDNRKGTVLGFNATSGDPEVGPTIADVSSLASITADIATLADIEDGTDATDAIQTVAGISSNVSTVAGISSNVTTVAGNTSNINAVAADATDIGTVAGSISNVNTVAGIDSNITTVAGNTTNINTVAGNNSNITTVAGVSANVTTVAGISSDVTTVAGISSDVTTVAADGTDIGTVATNIADVNTVASNIATISAKVSKSGDTMTGDLTIQGNLTVSGTTITVDSATAQTIDLGDGDRMRFGDSNDAYIEWNGTYFDARSTGRFDLLSSGNDLRLSTGTNVGLIVNHTGGTPAVQLYNSGVQRLATTSTGIDVTGTVTADGLTVEKAGGSAALFKGYTSVTSVDSANNGEILLGNNSSYQGRISYEGNGGVLYIENSYSNNAADILFRARSSGTAQNKLLIEGTGDISFYEDTGTTAKFFWDASAEVLGIGTATPNVFSNTGLHIHDSTTSRLHMTNGTTGSAYTDGWEMQAFSDDFYILGREAAGDIIMYPANSEAMRIDSSGRVGIGTSSPFAPLQITHTNGRIGFNAGNTSGGTKIQIFTTANADGYLAFEGYTKEYMRIDSSGNLLVGKTALGYNTSSGTELWSNGFSAFTRDNAVVSYFNRKTSDGDLVQFLKDGTTVGSIGSDGGSNLVVKGSGNSAALLFNHTNARIEPYVDNVTDLGRSLVRFKDLYLSGGVYLGGTAAANKLDDYESGSFTPSWGGSATAGTASGTFLGVYTKIGRVVYCTITLSGCNLTGASGALQLTGLPFSAASGNLKSGGTAYLEGVTPSFSYTPQTGSHVQVYVAGSSTTAQFRVGLSAQWDNYLNAASTFTSGGGSTYGTVSITYTT